MKRLIHDVTASASFWAFIAGGIVTITLIFFLVTWLNRADLQRAIDHSAIESVERIDARVKAAIAEMREQDAKSSQQRNELRKEVGEIRQELKTDGNR
jgi:septal ring factor EnvC (AmiA/AmiB activator)